MIGVKLIRTEYPNNLMIKKILFMMAFLISLSAFTQCSGQKNITKMKIFEKELVFPDMSSEYERLTSSEIKFIKSKKELAVEKYPQESNLNRKTQVEVYTEYNKEGKTEYNFNDENNTIGISKYIKIEPEENIKDFEKSIYFLEYKTFSGDKLVEKGLSLIRETSFLMYLKKYKYDEGGNIIDEYDYSKNFKQSLPDILKILEKYNLSIEFNNAILIGGNRSYLTTIQAVNSNYGKVWVIVIGGNYIGIIDDATGEIIVHNTDAFLKDKFTDFSITNKIMNNYEWDIMIDKTK